MRRSRGGIAHRQTRRARLRERASASVAVALAAVVFGLSACSASTPLDRLLADRGAEPGPCWGPTFGRVIDVAQFECWRVVGVDDIEVLTDAVAVAVNGGTAPDPDRSYCFTGLPAAPDAVVACSVEFGADETWFAVVLERDLYSAQWDALDAAGDFPPGTPVTIVVARSKVSLTPEDG